MSFIQKITHSKWGGAILGTLAVAALVVLIVQFSGLWRQSAAASIANDRIFVCSETGKAFHVTIADGMTFPVHSPYSGRDTGYPAEMCYWTADGQIKSEPTPVLLNAWVGIDGPTFCPDCGRLVKARNAFPSAGDKPPPTKEEYEARHSHSRSE